MKKWLKKRNKMEQKRGKQVGKGIVYRREEKKRKNNKKAKEIKFKQKLKERKVMEKGN